MKKLIFMLSSVICVSCFAQESLLTKKIVYTIKFTENSVKSSQTKDSVSYEYKVNKRFFWEAMDALMSDLKSKKQYLTTFNGDTIQWDTMLNNLTKQLQAYDLKKYSKKELQNVLENEIRAVKFMEEWTYSPETLLINKRITAFCPVIERDSVTLVQEDLKAKESFLFDMGWIRPKTDLKSDDTLLICRNIQYTMPIYNFKPYHWWDNNLEAEYSIRYFDDMIAKAESRTVLCYESPDTPEPYTKSELDKRKRHSHNMTIVNSLPDNEVSETDTTIYLTYNSEDITFLRFGEQIVYDKKNARFFKQTNYLAPIITVYGSDGEFHGYYPLFYLRKE